MEGAFALAAYMAAWCGFTAALLPLSAYWRSTKDTPNDVLRLPDSLPALSCFLSVSPGCSSQSLRNDPDIKFLFSVDLSAAFPLAPCITAASRQPREALSQLSFFFLQSGSRSWIFIKPSRDLVLKGFYLLGMI